MKKPICYEPLSYEIKVRVYRCNGVRVVILTGPLAEPVDWRTPLYERNGDKRAWAKNELKEAGASDNVAVCVERLLDALWVQKLNEDEVAEMVDAFSMLAQGYALPRPKPEDPAIWEPAKPGGLVVRDEVRVKKDAYKADVGMRHNGRKGVVVAIRSGDILVKYEGDEKSTYQPSRHSPHALEKRIG